MEKACFIGLDSKRLMTRSGFELQQSMSLYAGGLFPPGGSLPIHNLVYWMKEILFDLVISHLRSPNRFSKHSFWEEALCAHSSVDDVRLPASMAGGRA